MPASATASPDRIKDVNTRYHDAAADEYDSKWGIDFGPLGQEQVRAKLTKALGAEPRDPFADALEIGAGTGYFSLNLLQLGLAGRATATDISPGMLTRATLDQQQPRTVARSRRAKRDQFGRKLEIEQVDAHLLVIARSEATKQSSRWHGWIASLRSQ